MTPSEALAAHARLEAVEANATRFDVQNALRSARRALHQPDKDRWRVGGGTDLDGDELVLVVVFEGDLVVITVF